MSDNSKLIKEIFDEIDKLLIASLEKTVEDTALIVQAEARDMVPYDTGQLHDSIQVEMVDKLNAKVSANTDYAYYVHEGYVNRGGKFIQGTPYLTQPLTEQTEKIPQRIIENAKGLLP